MATEEGGTSRLRPESLLRYVRLSVYTLTGVLATSLLVVGTVGLITVFKNSLQPGRNWHWGIHLESTISYMGLFMSRLLLVLVPLFCLLVVGRWLVADD